MSRKVTVDLELPDEVVEKLRVKDLSRKAKEALIMELLREHRISQGMAAQLLDLSREQLFPLMAKYQVSVVDLSSAELREEMDKPLPRP